MTPAAPQWSPYQTDIFDAVTQTKDSLLVEAVAGSGKTTTLVEAASRTKACRGLSLAFNKRVQEELAQRLPRHFEAKTLNALGHQAWGAKLGKRLKVASGKIFALCQDLNVPTDSYSDIMQLVNMGRNAGIVPKTDDDTPALWEELADTYDINYSADLLVYAREVLVQSIAQAQAGVIDFVDQIYMPTCFDGRFQTFDIVMVDEAQDLSSLQHDMIAKLLHPRSRIIAVGDSRQAIYGFRGALNNSMTRLRDRFTLRELPLTISYRCPQAVVAEAQTIVTHIEASPEAPIGSVRKMKPVHISDFPNGSAILCRNNAPLVAMAWKFIRAGVPVKFLGRDLGKQLKKLLEKLAKKEVPIEVLEENLRKWVKREVNRHPRREGAIEDKAATLRALFTDCTNSRQVAQKISQIFDQETGGRITLASIHTSKGFEWPAVFFLNEWLIPSQYANLDWQLEQEDNLRYVAITRAQSDLIYINLEDVL